MLVASGAGVWGVVLWRHRLLERRNRELESAVHQRTAELETERTKVLEEKRRADQASEAKGLFLAHMSHEIRTPLNGVVGLSRLLEDMSDPAEALETVRVIRSSADSLLKVVNDVLDFSKIEAGKLDLDITPFSLRRCIEESIGPVPGPGRGKGLAARKQLCGGLAVMGRGRQCTVAAGPGQPHLERREVHRFRRGYGFRWLSHGARARLVLKSPSRCMIPALESIRIICPACFLRSARRMLPSVAATEAPVWDWPSPSNWWN